MSLLGIDVGTSGCKAAVYRTDGTLLASAYEEYDVRHPRPGWAELDSFEVWDKVQVTIARAAAESRSDPVRALAVSSLGEALVPVSPDRRILGPSILNYDARGSEYLTPLAEAIDATRLYHITGNSLGNHFSLTKLMWLRDTEATRHRHTHSYLLWGSLVGYLLGGEAAVDWSLANRTLLFDIERRAWSEELVAIAGLSAACLARLVPPGTAIGRVSAKMAETLGLPQGIVIVSGAHDQCANALGAGATAEGRAMYGIGTYACIVAPFAQRHDPNVMMSQGLNTEHHAVEGLYVSFLYNHGGSMLKWYRDTFASAEYARACGEGKSVYPELLGEMPEGPSGLVVLPHFSVTGPPRFISDSRGVVVGLTLETPRGTIAKGILEGSTYYLRACVEALPRTGIAIESFCAVGGGSRSDAWVQLSADILDRPIVRPRISEAGTLGAAILAGVGVGEFTSARQGADSMVQMQRRFEPRPAQVALYNEWFQQYTALYPLLGEYLANVARAQSSV